MQTIHDAGLPQSTVRVLVWRSQVNVNDDLYCVQPVVRGNGDAEERKGEAGKQTSRHRERLSVVATTEEAGHRTERRARIASLAVLLLLSHACALSLPP